MAETLSPNSTMAQKQRLPLASRIQSPTSPFFLGSNDDRLERAQVRAARAAAIRRKSIVANAQLDRITDNGDPGLDKQQILDLFHNCIKLSSENKINQKNSWELNLIDHLTEIIKTEEENDEETNFQKASCTLEAGVKIYSLRVDSVHSEAYKVLGGMNRAGQGSEQDTAVEDVNADSRHEGGLSKKEIDKRISPLSTLESSFEALNVKKFDAAFVVDPLYHQTSAQFDEGGAKGLLINNLGLYGGCRVLFDSLEVPRKCMTTQNHQDKSDTIDLSFATEYIEQMVQKIRLSHDISPTLRNIVNQFDEDNKRESDIVFSDKSMEHIDAPDHEEIEFDRDGYGNCSVWHDDHDDQTSVTDIGPDCVESDFQSCPQENEPLAIHDPDMDDRFQNVDDYLFLSLGFKSKQNSWAGPDHWKYRKTTGSEAHAGTEDGSLPTTKRPRNKKQAEVDIDFTIKLEKNILDILAPPKNSKSILLPESRPPCNTKLPEDCHYQPEDLVKLFLLPKVKCIGQRGKKFSDESREQCDDDGSCPSWDDVCGGGFDDGDDIQNVVGDLGDYSTLVSQPRQVNKVGIQYDKTAKQVDVQALKKTLWNHIQETVELPAQDQEEIISFRQILTNFPSDCNAAATINDISPHLCFICLLHLANEHGLSIQSCNNLDDLTIHLPRRNGALEVKFGQL